MCRGKFKVRLSGTPSVQGKSTEPVKKDVKADEKYVDNQKTQSILEKVPTAELALVEGTRFKTVDEVGSNLSLNRLMSIFQNDTLYGHSFSMSERLFENTPPREDSDIERAKITGELSFAVVNPPIPGRPRRRSTSKESVGSVEKKTSV
jgi:hypothetical protein